MSKPPRLPTLFFIVLVLFLADLNNAFASTDRLLVTNATIITMAKGSPFIVKQAHFIVNAKGVITKISREAPPPNIRPLKTLNASGKIIIPGFLSGHSHLWQSAFRGFAPNQNLWGWILKKRKLIPKNRVQPGDLRLLTLHGIYDYLINGITTVYHHSQNPTGSPKPNEEQFYSHLEAPQRFVFGYRLPKKANDKKTIQQITQLRKKGKTFDHFLGLSLGGLGLFKQGNITSLKKYLSLARSLGLPIQAHYLEGPTLIKQERKNFQLLVANKGLKQDITFAHFVHPNDKILKTTAKAGLKMIWNPLSNGRLGSGLADIPKYLKHGLKVGMGLDGQASADLSDPFENMRMGLYSLRMKYQKASIMTPYQILELHTRKTAEVLGVENKVGSLEVGKYADFLVINLNHPNLGAITNLLETLVFAGSSKNIDEIYIGGKLVVKQGQPRSPAYTNLKADMPKLMGRYGHPQENKP